MSGRSGRLGGERGVSSAPQATVAGEFYRRAQKPAPRFDAISHIDRYADETAAPTQKRDTLHTILHIIGIILALLILLLVSTRAHAQGSVNQNTYDSQGQLKIVCSGCSAASSVTVNDPSVTTQKAGVSAAGNLAVECKVGCAGGATTPADSFANPTTAGLSFDFLALWNGATWDRWKGDATNGAFVNVKTSVLPTGAAADSSLTAIDTDLKANITLHAGTNVIGHVINDSGSTTAVTGNVASTIADGADVTLGAKADAKSAATDVTAITLMQVMKEISFLLQNKLLVTPDSVALPANQSVNEAQIGGVVPSIDSSGRQIIKLYPDTTTTSYHASKKFAASSTTDVAVMPGNATNKVILDKVTLTCTQTTAGQINVELVKRSAADTVGTSASITAVPDYSSYAAAVSAPLSYTGTGPTTGAAVGDLDNAQIGCMAAATATPNDIYVFKPAKPIILNGTAEQVAINLGGAITGGNITVTFDWRETTTP